MLTSQRTYSARNIPTFAATVVRTRQPRQIMTEDHLLSGTSRCKNYTGMAEAAKAENKAMRGGGGWRELNANGLKSVGAIAAAMQAVMDHMNRVSDWQGSAEIAQATGLPQGAVRAALHSLVVGRHLERKVVSRGQGFAGGRKGLWRAAQ